MNQNKIKLSGAAAQALWDAGRRDVAVIAVVSDAPPGILFERPSGRVAPYTLAADEPLTTPQAVAVCGVSPLVEVQKPNGDRYRLRNAEWELSQAAEGEWRPADFPPGVSTCDTWRMVAGDVREEVGHVEPEKVQAELPNFERMREAGQALLDHYDRETCRHEETKRLGFIWTKCLECDEEWADDRGGFVPYVEPDWVTAAREVFDAPAPLTLPHRTASLAEAGTSEAEVKARRNMLEPVLERDQVVELRRERDEARALAEHYRDEELEREPARKRTERPLPWESP